MKTVKSKTLAGCLAAITAEIIFGLGSTLTKAVGGNASTFELLSWRFFIAFIGANICLLTGIIKINLRGKNILRLLAIALLFPVVYFIFENLGINNTSASETGVIIATVPIFSIICSAIFLKKKPTLFQLAGITVTIAGVIITVLSVGLTADFSLFGYICLFTAVLSFSFYSVLAEKSTDISDGEKTYFMLMTGFVVFAAVALSEAGVKGTLSHLITLPLNDTSFLITVLFQGLGCSLISCFLTNISISCIGVNGQATFIGLSTVSTIISGIVFLGENLSASQIIGAVIIIAGIYIANIRLTPQKAL